MFLKELLEYFLKKSPGVKGIDFAMMKQAIPRKNHIGNF